MKRIIFIVFLYLSTQLGLAEKCEYSRSDESRNYSIIIHHADIGEVYNETVNLVKEHQYIFNVDTPIDKNSAWKLKTTVFKESDDNLPLKVIVSCKATLLVGLSLSSKEM